MENNKKVLIIVAVVLIIIALALGISKYTQRGAYESAIEGCGPDDKFSTTSGEPCNPPCEGEGDVYNRDTGEPCQN